MTITVNFIEGSRKSACRNDAWSVVRNGHEVLDIIPCAALPAGQGSRAVAAAFTRAVQNHPAADAPAVKSAAHRLLGLQPA